MAAAEEELVEEVVGLGDGALELEEPVREVALPRVPTPLDPARDGLDPEERAARSRIPAALSPSPPAWARRRSARDEISCDTGHGAAGAGAGISWARVSLARRRLLLVPTSNWGRRRRRFGGNLGGAVYFTLRGPADQVVVFAWC